MGMNSVNTAVTVELTDDQLKAVETIERLLRLAGKNQNENEAAVAMAKAQELLTRFNLDMAIIEETTGADKKRVKEEVSGGFYKWQQQLWEEVARLNFCLYWSQRFWNPEKKQSYRARYDDWYGHTPGGTRKGGYDFQHRVVGRKVNVISTQNMARYLEGCIEKLLRERLGETWAKEHLSAWSNSYRMGIVHRVSEKIWDRRREMIREDRERQQKAARKAAESGMSGVSDSTALTISTYQKREWDENVDFIYGEGTAAQWAAEKAEQAKAQAEADAEYAQWAAAHPEEAAREEKKRRDRERKKDAREQNRKEKESFGNVKDWGAFRAGYKAGEDVSLNPQVDKDRPAGLIGGSK